MGASGGKYKRNEKIRHNPTRQSEQTWESVFSTTLRRPGENLNRKKNKALFVAKLYELPFEVLDIILQKSYLHWILNSPKSKSDEDVFRSLISVDVCFNRRITGRRFKRKILRYFKGQNLNRKKSKAPSRTTLYDIPFEVLDIILNKSYLHLISDSSTKQRDEEVFRSLLSVDVCFNRRITSQRFKIVIWRNLKDLYARNETHSANFRNNKDFLLKSFHPNDELIDSLFSLKCITEEQRQFIKRQHSNQDKNSELLQIARFFDNKKYSYFARCLRQTDQKAVARVVENGGVVIKVKVKSSGATYAEFINIHQRMNELLKRTKAEAHQIDKHISQLKEKGLEILNSQLERQTVVVWIWCRSKAALKHIQRMYESMELRHIFFEIMNPSTSLMINIDWNQFKKSVVASKMSIDFTQRITIPANKYARGVTKLRNEIYVICSSVSFERGLSSRSEVRVFEDRNQFRLQKTIELKEIRYSEDIVSSEKINCIYVSDYLGKCVWKITRERGGKHKIIKWLTTDYSPNSLSVNNDGQLLVVNYCWSSILSIYGSVAELVQSIQLPRWMGLPFHAVETSIGNFLIIHGWVGKEEGKTVSIGTGSKLIKRMNYTQKKDRRSMSAIEEKEIGEAKQRWSPAKTTVGLSELSRDGKTVIRCFVPLNETQQLKNPRYLSIDSDDRVFVAHSGNGRVIVLDNDLKWNRILLPATDEDSKSRPKRLCYDEDNTQLIVVDNCSVIWLLNLTF